MKGKFKVNILLKLLYFDTKWLQNEQGQRFNDSSNKNRPEYTPYFLMKSL